MSQGKQVITHQHPMHSILHTAHLSEQDMVCAHWGDMRIYKAAKFGAGRGPIARVTNLKTKRILVWFLHRENIEIKEAGEWMIKPYFHIFKQEYLKMLESIHDSKLHMPVQVYAQYSDYSLTYESIPLVRRFSCVCALCR